jgi:N-acetylmuramoyl-L-alanine amidase
MLFDAAKPTRFDRDDRRSLLSLLAVIDPVRLLHLVALLMLPQLLHAGVISSVGQEVTATGLQVTVEADQPFTYKSFSLDNPPRAVFDLDGVRLARRALVRGIGGGGVNRLRSGPRGSGVRLVFDLEQSIKASHETALSSQGYQLKIRFPVAAVSRAEQTSNIVQRDRVRQRSGPIERGDQVAVKPATPALAESLQSPTAPSAAVDSATGGEGGSAAPSPVTKRWVVAIDAGHGGRDPGALGPRGTREKDVVLQIARELQRQVAAEPTMSPLMIRNRDRFIPLRERSAIARKGGADLFVSIHADSFRDHGANGASVYILSRDGASSEAALWLAESENRSDLVGGVKLEERDQMVASVLLDMSQSRTLEESRAAARSILRGLGRSGRLHSRRVQRAGFAVLKSPDIPSILIETGFLSNPVEERNLLDPDYQGRLAAAILEGVRSYFANRLPEGVRMAELQRGSRAGGSSKSHTIRYGETLFSISRRYGVDLSALRRVNGLRNNQIIEGRRLVIPGGA